MRFPCVCAHPAMPSFPRPRAGSVTTGNTGWIILTVALLVGAIVLLAVPQSPVLRWITTQILGIPTISSVQATPNPGNTGSTAGWVVSNGSESLTATTVQGTPALQWDNSASGYNWVWEYVQVSNQQTYRFTVEFEGTGEAELNVWNGQTNIGSGEFPLDGQWTTETMTVTIDEASGNPSPPEIQVASTDSGSMVDFQQATVVPA